jgi:hypothetical protein
MGISIIDALYIVQNEMGGRMQATQKINKIQATPIIFFIPL